VEYLSLELLEAEPPSILDHGLHDIYIHPADGLERPRFVLAILELAFLMRRKRRAESRCDRFSQLRGCSQREQP
jgi:hypothetical protein